MQNTKSRAKRLLSIILNILYIVLFILLIERFGIGKGLMISLLFMFMGVAWRFYKERAQFLDAIRLIEYKTFGKPLEREYWKPGELAKKKIKIVWKKPEAKK